MDIEIQVRVFTRHDNPNKNEEHPLEILIYGKEKSVTVNSKAEVWDAFDDIKITAAQKVKDALVEQKRIDEMIELTDEAMMKWRNDL